MTAHPDPRPAKRYRATKAEWEYMRAIKLHGRECRCGCGEYATTLHHIVGRDLGGDDCLPNLVPLAGSGTSGCHGLVEEMDAEKRRALFGSFTVQERAYAASKKGEHWLADSYGGGGAEWSRASPTGT